MTLTPKIKWSRVPLIGSNVKCVIYLRTPKNLDSILALCDAIGHDWYTDEDCEMNFCSRCGHMEGDERA